MIRSRCAGAALLASLAGCAGGFSGVGGSSQYACQAPRGTSCASISGIYANGPNGQRIAVRAGSGKTAITPYAPSVVTVPLATPPASEGLRSAPRVLRVWIAPWEDSDGDLHEESIVHVLVDSGRWRIPRVREERPANGEATAPIAPVPTTPPLLKPSTPRVPSRP